MSSQGPNYVGTGADNNAIGTTTWINTGNITADDGSSASTSAAITTSTHYLVGTNCSFSIPAGLTVKGIYVEIKRYYNCVGARPVVDHAVRIVKGGVIGSTDRSSISNWPKSPGSSAYATYGSSTDLWGLSWAASDINSSSFGVAISVSMTHTAKGSIACLVDAIRITVYYSAAASSNALAFGQDF